jgi:hypothetical protein
MLVLEMAGAGLDVALVPDLLVQRDLIECLEQCVAIDQRRLLAFVGNLVDQSHEQPHGQRDVHRGIEQDHPEMRVAEPQCPKHQEHRDGNRDERHHARRQNEEQQIILERELEAAERTSRQCSKKDRQQGRAKADNH